MPAPRALTGIRGRVLSIGAVVVGLVAVYGAGTIHPGTTGAAASVGQTSRAPVTSAIRACAAPGSSGATESGLATVAVPGSASAGSAVVTRLTGAGSAGTGAHVQTLTSAGKLALTTVGIQHGSASKASNAGTGKAGKAKTAKTGRKSASSGSLTTAPGQGGVMVQASGAMAQGLEVEQTGQTGLVTAQCQAPGTSFWFAGPGTTVAPDVELYLMNPGSEPADVQVAAMTDSGPLLGNSDSGIVVPAHGIIVQTLGPRLRTARVIALHVTTSIGRVVAAVRQTKRMSDNGAWIPASAAPSRELIIPGLPATSGTRQLYIAVPGGKSAQLKVTAITKKGSYQPTGGGSIDLPGDSAEAVPLPSLSGVAAAIKVTSSVPVTASVLAPGGATGSPGAITAAASPISEQGVAADNPGGKEGSASLILSAPAGAATVRVSTGTAGSGVSAQSGPTEHIDGGHSIVLRLKPPGGKKEAFSVVVTPETGSGPVYAARLVQTGSTVRSIMPLSSALTWVPLPRVQPASNAVSISHRGH